MTKNKLQAINTEDWWAVWFGAIIVIIAILGFLGKAPKIGEWVTNPLAAFQSYTRSAPLEVKPDDLVLKGTVAKNLGYDAENKLLIYKGILTVERRDDLKKLSPNPLYLAAVDQLYAAKPTVRGNNLLSLLILLILLGGLTTIGTRFMGEEALRYLSGFAMVFVLAIIAYVCAKQYTINAYGLGYAFWALLIGLLISNTIGVPKWLLAGAKTEMYIKTGLVLLGAEILFGKILKLGGPGLFVAWLVTPTVIIFM